MVNVKIRFAPNADFVLVMAGSKVFELLRTASFTPPDETGPKHRLARQILLKCIEGNCSAAVARVASWKPPRKPHCRAHFLYPALGQDLTQNFIGHYPFGGARPRIVRAHSQIGETPSNSFSGFSIKNPNKHSMLCAVNTRHYAE